jgi:SAM-dependent methyltransferase
MALDVGDLRSFYASPLGRVARRIVGRRIRERWESCVGQSILGLGYATPYVSPFRDEALRVLAFMPAEQGVVNWPEAGLSSTALVSADMVPLPDSCIDRAIIAHALETLEHPREMLAEAWRILTPGGRLIVVAPNRRGLWARVDSTPFGYGQPYSRGQLRDLLRETLFSPIYWTEALYVPPFARPSLLRLAPAFERLGGRLMLPGAGVHLVEATKQLYRPVGLRSAAARAPRLAPVAIPGAGMP